MAPYDSDDSFDEDQDYTETNVLLGYASKDADEDTISRLGGRPEWIDSSNPPSSSLARCKVCKDLMVVLLQLNAELHDRFPGHERRLYVFSCRRKSCRRKEGSIRALRGVRISAEAAAKAKARKEKEQRDQDEKEKAEAERKEKEKGLGEALFGVQGKAAFGAGAGGATNLFSSGGGSQSANPFAKTSVTPLSTASGDAAKAQEPNRPLEHDTVSSTYTTKDLPKTFAETLSLNNPQEAEKQGPPPPPEPWPPESEQPKPFPLSYLADAEYETLDPIPMPKDLPTSMEIDDSATGVSGGGGKEDKDVFESSIDSTFQKFADRLAQNPDQCIRYEFNGQPLLYSKTDAVGRRLHEGGGRIPPCENCRGERVFEVQLVPAAIAELEADEEGLEGMDWGTIIVGTCATDCVPGGTASGEAGYLEEWAGVQWEELTQRR